MVFAMRCHFVVTLQRMNRAARLIKAPSPLGQDVDVGGAVAAGGFFQFGGGRPRK
jgi:hypothetical protein